MYECTLSARRRGEIVSRKESSGLVGFRFVPFAEESADGIYRTTPAKRFASVMHDNSLRRHERRGPMIISRMGKISDRIEHGGMPSRKTRINLRPNDLSTGLRAIPPEKPEGGGGP